LFNEIPSIAIKGHKARLQNILKTPGLDKRSKNSCHISLNIIDKL